MQSFSMQPGPHAAEDAPIRTVGAGSRSALAAWGIADEKIEALFAAGVLGKAEAENFDQKIERDAKAGKLDRLAGDAVDDFYKGGVREL